MSKVIKLSETQLNNIVNRVLKEQSPTTPIYKCSGINTFLNYGYEYNGHVLQKDITPGIRFYITPTPTTSSKYCNFTLIWEDGMTPIDLGKPDYCYSIAKAYEEAFKMKRS